MNYIKKKVNHDNNLIGNFSFFGVGFSFGLDRLYFVIDKFKLWIITKEKNIR